MSRGRGSAAGRPPLPERRPRLALAFALLPLLLVGSLLLSGPLLYETEGALGEVFVPPASSVLSDPEDPVATPIPLPDWDKKERVNILLVGVDRREGDEYSRTDTIILVTVDPAARTIGLMPFPRDLKVDIPRYSPDKINAAYTFGERDKWQWPDGGVGLLRRTILRNFGIPVHYYAQVDFRGFERAVDELGGVNVDAPYPIKDDEYPTETYGYTGVYFPAGLQHLDGKTALRYARTRHADGDAGRSRRQQEIILSLRRQAQGGNIATLLTRAKPLLDILGDSARTDLSSDQLLALAKLGLEIPDGNTQRFDLYEAVTEGTEVNEAGEEIFYLYPNWSQMQLLLGKMIPNLATALTLPDPAVKIGVQNGTYRDRFAAQSVERLKKAGFAGATVDAADTIGDGSLVRPLPQTIIFDYTANGAMAIVVARKLGLPDDTIRLAAGPGPNGVDILVVAGEDLPYIEPTPTPKPTATPRPTPTPRPAPTPRR